jgi:hypothetical protein
MKKLATLILVSTVLFAGCGFNGKRIKGNNEVTTENRNSGNFSGVSSFGSFNVYVANGPFSVKIEAESNILPYIETFVEDNTLKVRTRKGVWLSTNKDVKIFITAPRFTKIHSVGSGDIIGQSKIVDSSRIDLHVSGNGKINLDVDAPEVVAELTGNGGVYLKGQSRFFDCKLLGNGNLKAFDLMAEETKVHIMGNGDAEVYASVKLDVSLTGNGTVHYKGNAQPSTHITGNGSITQVK